MAITDLITPVTSSATARPITDTLAAPGYTHGATSATLAAGTNWADGVIYFSIYTTTTIGSTTVKDPTTQTDWKATKSGTALSNMILTGGSSTKDYVTGAIVEQTPTSRWAYDQYQWQTAHGNLDGSLKASAVQTALGLGASSLNGWNALGFTFSTVTYLGNRSYSCVVASNDVTGTLSAGMRLRTTRTVPGPTQATNLNGTNQFWSKTSPAGMTFTDDFVAGAWVKLSAYPTGAGFIISRYNGTSGWELGVSSAGQVFIQGRNGGSANASTATSYQSIPLNKWVHIAAQLDMSAFTATTTTSYVMIDGVDVPVTVTRGGTNPTALVQAGNLEIGSENGGLFPLPGKIAQAFVTNAKVLQATIQSNYYAQTVSPTETSVISTFPFNGNGNDANTTNANNLTANNGATATNADSPFGGQADGTISSTLDYGIVQKATFSTNTTVIVQVPEGCTIPTSGGVASVAYSSNATPYGMPSFGNGPTLLGEVIVLANSTTTATSPTQIPGMSVTVANPVPGRRYRLKLQARGLYTTGPTIAAYATLWAGTVGSGTILMSYTGGAPGGTVANGVSFYGEFIAPSSTSITFNAAINAASAATATLEGGVNNPSIFQVEVL